MACAGDGEHKLRERTDRRLRAAPSESRPAAEPDQGAPSEEVAGTDDSVEDAPVDHAADDHHPADVRQPAKAGPRGPLDRAALAAKVLDDTVSDALAAAHAAEVGASLCDAAYESAAELVRVVRERFPDEVRDMPPRELFVDHCQTLPEPAQQCLVVRYAVTHADECRRVRDALPDAQRRRMEQLLAGR